MRSTELQTRFRKTLTSNLPRNLKVGMLWEAHRFLLNILFALVVWVPNKVGLAVRDSDACLHIQTCKEVEKFWRDQLCRAAGYCWQVFGPRFPCPKWTKWNKYRLPSRSHLIDAMALYVCSNVQSMGKRCYRLLTMISGRSFFVYSHLTCLLLIRWRRLALFAFSNFLPAFSARSPCGCIA
jgi:hypothetical protein